MFSRDAEKYRQNHQFKTDKVMQTEGIQNGSRTSDDLHRTLCNICTIWRTAKLVYGLFVVFVFFFLDQYTVFMTFKEEVAEGKYICKISMSLRLP